MKEIQNIAILGAGNIGSAIARGLVASGSFTPRQVILTRRDCEPLRGLRSKGFDVRSDNRAAVRDAQVLVVAVEPGQIDGVLEEIREDLDATQHLIISVVTGAEIQQIKQRVGGDFPVIRAMPNTAIAVRESMTCLSADDKESLEIAESIFQTVGKTVRISEDQMVAATALGACGVAFFLRAVRAASQGGIEIGFHSEAALSIAAQTAKGASSLLLAAGQHPEAEIDRVTTPRGCTIAGLNRMEHEGFSSAMIKGITTSAKKAAGLYSDDGD